MSEVIGYYGDAKSSAAVPDDVPSLEDSVARFAAGGTNGLVIGATRKVGGSHELRLADVPFGRDALETMLQDARTVVTPLEWAAPYINQLLNHDTDAVEWVFVIRLFRTRSAASLVDIFATYADNKPVYLFCRKSS